MSRMSPCAHMCSTSNLISYSEKPQHILQGASTSLVREWTQLRMRSCQGSHPSPSSYQLASAQSSFQYPPLSSFKPRSPCVSLVKACKTAHNPPKQAKKQSQRPGRSKHQYHFFKRTGQSETGTKAANLVEIVMSLSNVKEEIYATLDEWVAFEVEFPKIALGKALRRLKEQEQWQRIIQVSKWMLSKGQGKTVGTYGLMLKAYEMDSRLDDCRALWEKILMRYANSMPKSMFVRMLHIYKRQQMPEELVQVFKQMEDFKVRPDKDTLEMVKEAYRQIGQPDMDQILTSKYPPAWNYVKFKGRSVKVRPRQEMKVPADEAGDTLFLN